MLKKLMIHKTVLRLSAFISRNASCWHCYTVITSAIQRKRAGDRGLLWIPPKIYIHLHAELLWCSERGEQSQGSKAGEGGTSFAPSFSLLCITERRMRGHLCV